jgi:hypothetical protein
MCMPSLLYCRHLLLVTCLLFAPIFAWGQVGVPSTQDQLISTAKYPDGTVIPYMLTTRDGVKPKRLIVLMPGGMGNLDPRLEDGRLVFNFAGNFLIRSRHLFADDESLIVSTNSTESPERMRAILLDMKQRYGALPVLMIGTSKSTYSTMELARKMDGEIVAFVHTASMNSIASFDPRSLKSKHLLVHHLQDACHLTGYYSAKRHHERYETPLITMQGGWSEGDPCLAAAYHGFKGIEVETVNKIRQWLAGL